MIRRMKSIRYALQLAAGSGIVYTLTVAEAGLNLFWLDRAVWNLDFTYSQGLRWLGADDDANHAVSNLPKAQFHKYRAGLSQWRNGQFGAQAWQWQSQLNLHLMLFTKRQ